MTVLMMVMWLAGTAPTAMSAEFETPKACEDAKEVLAQQLSKLRAATYLIECVPKGEIRT